MTEDETEKLERHLAGVNGLHWAYEAKVAYFRSLVEASTNSPTESEINEFIKRIRQ